MSKVKRKSLTRTRHLRKTLIIISQRAGAVANTARANVTFFYKCVKTRAWFFPFIPFFKVYRTEEVDNNTYLPIWENLMTGWKCELWRSHFAKTEIYNSYNSWYLRAGIPKSQTVSFEAYDLTPWEKIKLLFIRKPKKQLMTQKELKELEEFNAQKYKMYTTIDEKTKKLLDKNKVIDVEPKKVVKLKHEHVIKTKGINEHQTLWGAEESKTQDSTEKSLLEKSTPREKLVPVLKVNKMKTI